MKLAILIPSTTNNRNWNSLTESYILKSIQSLKDTRDENIDYKFYIMYDNTDTIWCKKTEREIITNATNDWADIQFIKNKNIEKGWLSKMWNKLYDIAMEQKCDYFWMCGDDIIYDKKGWITDMIVNLKNNNDIGIAGCFNGNNRILTQFMVSRKHHQIFGWYFNPLIKNWFLDDHLCMLYDKYTYISKDYSALNVGGEPRYEINMCEEFCKKLVQRDKKILNDYLLDQEYILVKDR
mgnify:FL=1